MSSPIYPKQPGYSSMLSLTLGQDVLKKRVGSKTTHQYATGSSWSAKDWFAKGSKGWDCLGWKCVLKNNTLCSQNAFLRGFFAQKTHNDTFFCLHIRNQRKKCVVLTKIYHILLASRLVFDKHEKGMGHVRTSMMLLFSIRKRQRISYMPKVFPTLWIWMDKT